MPSYRIREHNNTTKARPKEGKYNIINLFLELTHDANDARSGKPPEEKQAFPPETVAIRVSPLPPDLHSGDKTLGIIDESCLALEKVKTGAYIPGAWYTIPDIVPGILYKVFTNICSITLPGNFISILHVYMYVRVRVPFQSTEECDRFWTFELQV